jgi:chromosome partitioning protein
LSNVPGVCRSVHIDALAGAFSMPVVAIVNRKGGSGKSTLATHLAGYLACRGTPVMLGDTDRQQSTVPWLRRRAANVTAGAPIVSWVVDPRNTLRPPAGVTHVVLDTPAALQGFELQRLLNHADAVLVPLGDSPFDREAAAACIAELRAQPRVALGRVRLGAVGMRIDSRTKGALKLQDWAASLGVPLVTTLRMAQQYVRGTEQGLTLFDLPAEQTVIDREQWAPLIEWLAPVIDPPVRRPGPAESRVSALPGRGVQPPSRVHASAAEPVRSTTRPTPLPDRHLTSDSRLRSVAQDDRSSTPVPGDPPSASVLRRLLSWLNLGLSQPLRGSGPP